MNLYTLKKILFECYSKDLCYPKIEKEWSEKNRYLGMCAITALIVNDYFGGDICKIHVGDFSHYFNLLDSKIIDLTVEQFGEKISYDNYLVISRDQVLIENTTIRYNILKQKVKGYLNNVEKRTINE